jgi:hypothetical protein
MRATLALILLATAWASEAGAQPPPPYAADPQFNAGGQAAKPLPPRGSQGLDRYSGGANHAVATPTPQQYAFSAPAPQSVTAQAPARTLGWSGKVEAQQQVAPPAQGGWTQMTAHFGPAPAVGQPAAYPSYRAASVQPAANQGWRPLYPGAAPTTQGKPRTIYDPPSVSAQPQAQLQAPSAPQQVAPQQTAQAQNPNGPHFYSLHREYGIAPDPIPIPPRFFGPTADLSAPPPDPVLKRVTGSDGQTHTQAVPTDDQGS